ncbi:MAG TPA: hypothetical protein VGD97_03965 [Lacunisphaera sp.]
MTTLAECWLASLRLPAATAASHRPIPRTLRGVAALCALTVWLLGLFVASSQLHVALHTDAGHAGHSCAITLFSQGLEASLGCADLVVTPALFPAGKIATLPVVWLSDTSDRLPPGRGPPLC